jgi:hypothetical protein
MCISALVCPCTRVHAQPCARALSRLRTCLCACEASSRHAAPRPLTLEPVCVCTCALPYMNTRTDTGLWRSGASHLRPHRNQVCRFAAIESDASFATAATDPIASRCGGCYRFRLGRCRYYRVLLPRQPAVHGVLRDTGEHSTPGSGICVRRQIRSSFAMDQLNYWIQVTKPHQSTTQPTETIDQNATTTSYALN